MCSWSICCILFTLFCALSALSISFNDVNHSNQTKDALLTPVNVETEDNSINKTQAETTSCTEKPVLIDEIPIPTTSLIDLFQWTFSWQQNPIHKSHDDSHSKELTEITISFSIPETLSNESIENLTVYIIDGTSKKLLGLIDQLCIDNSSSFTIKYSTANPLPHDICLHLILSQTALSDRSRILFCRTINGSKNESSTDENHSIDEGHAVGPSGLFILSQTIIILVMMFIIFAVQTARDKKLADRFRERIKQTWPYKIVSRIRNPSQIDGNDVEESAVNPSRTLQAGLNRLAFLKFAAQHVPIEQQVLGANDLSTTLNERHSTRICLNRDLIDVKEFTKRISTTIESPDETELSNA